MASNYSRVGYNPPKSQTSNSWSLISIFRTIVTIIEIGLAFIPYFGILAQLGFGLIGGGLRQTLDIHSGSANVQNTLLNFLVPLGAYKVSRTFNLRSIARITKNADSFEDIIEALLNPRGFSEATLKMVKPTKVAAKAFIGAGKPTKAIALARAFEKLTKVYEFRKTTELIRNTSFTKGQAANLGFKLFTRQGTKKFTKKTIQENLILLNKKLKRFEKFVDQGDSIPMQRELLKHMNFTDHDINKFLKVLNSTTQSPSEKMRFALGFLKNVEPHQSTLKQNLNPAASGWMNTKLMFGNTRKVKERAFKLGLASRFVRKSNQAFGYKRRLPAPPLKKVTDVSRSFPRRIFDIAKRPGSRDFNDYILQPIQAIFDPNDAGRAIPEFAYRVIKKRLNKLKWFKPLAKKTLNIESLFTRMGGIRVTSDWHLGYRVISQNPVFNWVQITYGKDTGNLRNVYVWANKIQLRNYRRSPGHYYLKTWAYSKGGKRLDLTGLFGYSPGMLAKTGFRTSATFLSFLPNNAIRQVLSLITNPVENIYLLGKGKYFENYWKKFKGSAQRIAVNRTFRVLGKLVLGGLIAKKFGYQIGKGIGRELQRIGTNVLAPLVNTAIINAQRNKPISAGLTYAKVINKGLIGVKSNLRRLLRHQRGTSNVVINAYTIRRKLRIIARAPNTFAPKRPYRGFRFLK